VKKKRKIMNKKNETFYKLGKDFGLLKLSFGEEKVTIPTENGIKNGERTCECEVRCKVNIKEFFERHGIGFTKKSLDIIDRYIPLSTLSYKTLGGKTITKKVINECFTVKGKAVCSPEDEFDSDKGRRICVSKAKLKAYRKIKGILEGIRKLIEIADEVTYDSAIVIENGTEVESNWLNKTIY